MLKKEVGLFSTLLVFWVVVSGEVDLQHIIVGVCLSFLVSWIWYELNPKLPGLPSLSTCIRMCKCILRLLVSVIESNLTVAKLILFKTGSIQPDVAHFQPGLNSNWGKVFLANSITLTPGTLTIDVNPDNNEFTVYCFTQENKKGTIEWKLIDDIKRLESGRRK